MKKIKWAVALFAAMVSGNAFAQYTPEAGDFSTEVQFNPFSSDFGTFKLDQLKIRYFLTEKDAIRAGIGFGLDTDKYTPNNDNSDAYTKTKKGDFSFNVGYERHFFNYKRLDLYAGAELGINRTFVSATLHGANGEEVTYKNRNAAGTERANFGFGVAAVMGAEFYVYKGLYVGTELGFHVNSTKSLDSKVETTTSGGTSISNESNDTQRHTSMGFEVEPALRLGWTF